MAFRFEYIHDPRPLYVDDRSADKPGLISILLENVRLKNIKISSKVST